MKSITIFYNLLDVRHGYFIFYSFWHYWLSAILVIVVAFLFWLILKALQKYQSRFFEDGEVELGVLAALIVGWPGFVVFIPLLFLAVVLVSIFRMVFFKEAYTTLGAPMLFGVLLFLILGCSL